MLKKLLRHNVSIIGLTNVGDDDISAFAQMYADVPVAQRKNESNFMRDGLYYARGYLVLRNRGATHDEALEAIRPAAEADSRFDVDPAGTLPALGDDAIVDIAAQFTAVYKDPIGRFQRQSRMENLRDMTFYLQRYFWHRQHGRGHDNAVKHMLCEMYVEAGLPDPCAPKPGERSRREGLVQADGHKLRDDTGPFFPLGASLMSALWQWKHDRPRGEQNLKYLSEHTFDYARILGEVGGRSWGDRIIDPRDSDYEDVLASYLDTAYTTYGMRTELTLLGTGTGVDPMYAADRVIEVLRDRQHMIVNLEGANEAWKNFKQPAVLRALVKKLRQALPDVLIASSSPTNAEGMKNRMDLDIANFATVHSRRDVADGGWSAVRQPWDAKDIPSAVSYNEPPGLESSGAVLADPLRLTMLRALCMICGASAFVFHTGAGTRGGGQADVDMGRKANFNEYGELFDRCVAGFRAVDPLIHENAPNWQKVRHFQSRHPFANNQVWDDRHPLDRGIQRNYCAYGDGLFITMPIGVKASPRSGDPLFKAKDACAITVYEPTSDGAVEIVLEARLASGQSIPLAGATDRDGSKAYIVVGQVV
jgi:hypothetical protein